MITLTQANDLNWRNLQLVAYENELLSIAPSLLEQVTTGHAQFMELINHGVPCYGVTTGLGKMVTENLDATARAELPANMLRARAAAIGTPFVKPVARAMLMIRLVNFLSGRSGVRSELCDFIVDRLNDNFIPWIPSLGHGMAADAIANTHAFQTLIGEGFVFGQDNERQTATIALRNRNVKPFVVADREGLALINGVCAAPALAMDAYFVLTKLVNLAHLVAAVSVEGLAAPKDALNPAVATVSSEPGIHQVIEILRRHLANSAIMPHNLQAPISYRVIPQVHGAMLDTLANMRKKIECCLCDYSDNPLMDGNRLLSVGSFHNQHLVNQIEQVAIALAHIGTLSERRLHRLLSAQNTGLNPQLAARPGLDAGLVVTHKASIDLAARLRMLAQPVSLQTSETSGGQEDYMSMAIPAIQRLYDMADLTRAMLAYELLAGLTAVRMRDKQPGHSVAMVTEFFEGIIAPLNQDRSPAPDVETILEHLESAAFTSLTR